MKKILILPFLIIHVLFSQAQDNKAKQDTIKKINYSEIVKVDSTNRFELYKKAAKWMEKQGFEIEEEDPLTGKISAKNKFTVFTDKGVLSKPNGEFSHDVILEVKDGKYRYSFTNFMYRKLVQDRQDLLKYVPERGKKPIEESNAPGWKKQWGKNKMQVDEKITGYINNLRESLKYVAPKPVTPPKPKEEW